MRQKPDDGSLYIHLFINPHQDNATIKTQLETSKTTVWNKWLTRGNAPDVLSKTVVFQRHFSAKPLNV